MRAQWTLALGLLVLTALEIPAESPSAASSQVPRRWAVLPFQNVGGSTDFNAFSDSFGDLLTVALSGSAGMEVIDRENLRRLLQEKEIQLSASDDLSKAAIKGGLKGIQTLVAGNFHVSGNEVVVRARLIDVETAATLLSISEHGGLRELDQLCLRLAAQLLKDPTLLKQPSFTGRIDQSPLANLHFARGLGRYWGDDSSGAAAEFLKAVQIDPEQVEAAYWLAKSYAKCGLHLDAKLRCHQWLARWPDHPLRAETDRLLTQSDQSLSKTEHEFFQVWYRELCTFSNQISWSIPQDQSPLLLPKGNQ